MKRRITWLVGMAIATLIIITLIAAPGTSRHSSGSTYSHAPDGYGAWYSFMQQRGTTIQRWQQPVSKLTTLKSPATLLQVNSDLSAFYLSSQERDWVEKGNILVVLGVHKPATGADFSTGQDSPAGNVKIETSRRYQIEKVTEQIVGDRFGAIVWQEKIGKGKLIYATTPNLAANAYQDNLNNYNFLSQLVNLSNSIYVDEYIHGYKDANVKKSEGEGSVVSYLAKTPWFPAFVQTGVLLLVLIWAQNRRFGQPSALETKVVDNSEAYIQALAGVLQKAESHEFVVDVVGRAEQLQLQLALGLGQVPLDRTSLVSAYLQQTGDKSTDLDEVLQLQARPRAKTEKELLSWLQKWQRIRQNLPSSRA